MGFSHTVNADSLNALIREIAEEGGFAVVSALTAVGKDIEAAERTGLEASIDRPSPFTLNAFGTQAATKANPVARVFMRPIQSRYLQWLIDGGTRAYKGFELRIKGQRVSAFAMPRASLDLDQYGNVPRATLNRIIRDLDSPRASSL